MFLDEITEPNTIVETPDDYGRKISFDYRKERKGKELLSSPSPIVFYLGTWRMTDKDGNKKTFLCGLNLAYLADEEELAAIKQALPEILKSNNMKTRYRIGSTLLPLIFRRAYRTYNVNNIIGRPIRGRLYALKTSDDDKEEAKELASKDGLEWSELKNQERNQYLDKALTKRGAADVKRQEKSKKERKQIDKYLEPPTEPIKLEPEPEEEPEELSKALPPAPPPQVKPQKPAAFKPIELGPGYEELEPEKEPEIQSPLDATMAQMPRAHNLKIKKPSAEE